jgi:hypothetical protein
MRLSARVLIVVWCAAAGVRLLYLIVGRPPFTIYYYWDIAGSLLQNGSVSLEGAQTASVDLLYPLFLAAMRLALGDRPLFIQAVQALVAAAGAVYLLKLTAALTDSRRAAIAAAALFAVYPLLIRHSVDGTDSALLTTALIAFAYHFVTARSARDGAAAGAWLGIAMLARTVAWPLVVIAPLVAAARSRRVAITMMGIGLAMLTPAVARTYAVSGALVPTRDGINLFKANCEYASGVMAAYSVDVLGPYAESRLAAFGLADLPLTPAIERQRSVAFRRLALDEMRSHPFATLWLKIRNVVYFFSPVLVPYRQVTALTTIRLGVNGTSVVENTIPRPLSYRLAYSLSYSLVMAFAAFGVYRRRDAFRRDAILWCILFTFAAVHAIFFPTTRYRAPVDFVFLFYAAVGLDTWWVQGRHDAMAPLIRITRRGASFSPSDEELDRASARFESEHALHLPAFIDAELLSVVQDHIERDGFSEHVHDSLPSRPVDLRINGGAASSLLLLLTNDPPFLDFVRRLVRHPEIQSFAGSVARRVPGAGHEDAWHSDAVAGRLAALTVNVGREAYEGGVLQIREEPGGKIVYELANTRPGDAVLFKIDACLKHRVTAPEGRASRTAFAGWFGTDPVRRVLGLAPAFPA